MPVINANDHKINIEVSGPENAPALLFSNSLGTNLGMWDEQAKALSQSYRVIRYDQRGHGKSAAPKGPYTVEQLGGEVLAILDHLKIAKAHFCGLSMGGMTGMWLARMAPKRFHKMIFSNTGARIGTPDVWNTRISSVLAKGMASVTEATLDRWLSKGFRDSNPQAVAAVRKMLLSTPPQGFAGCSAAIRDTDQRWGIGAIKVPVMVIIGKVDPGTPPQLGEFMAKRIPGAKLVELDAAHLSNMEKSSQFTEAVKNFLA
jgi:3-oxoadipate enol-lactonase